jgi:hypothetical protein
MLYFSKKICYAALMTKQAPTAEQLDALQEWARVHGRNWKQALRDAWLSGDGRDAGPLRQLRNTLGPSWLNSFKLPTAS